MGSVRRDAGGSSGSQHGSSCAGGRGLHSLTSKLNLRTYGTHRSRQSSTWAPWETCTGWSGLFGGQSKLNLSGKGQSKLKLSGNGNECKPLAGGTRGGSGGGSQRHDGYAPGGCCFIGGALERGMDWRTLLVTLSTAHRTLAS